MAGNKRWSRADLDILEQKYGSMPVEELAVLLGRSVDAVQWKASKAGINFAREPYMVISRRLDALAAVLERIEQRLDDVEARANKEFRLEYTDRHDFIRANYKTMTRREMADALGMSHQTVTSFMHREKLRRYDKKRQKIHANSVI
jgi:DNA-directed RNA polymerase specialized sigma24 family protein